MIADNLVVDARTGRRATWGELVRHADPRPEPTAHAVEHSVDALPAVAALKDGGELLVVAAGRLDESLAEELRTDGFDLVAGDDVQAATSPRAAEDGRVWLLTSGSTGRPKRVGHTLASLSTVTGELAPRTWLCPYSPGTYAWWQVVTLGLGVPGQELVLVDPADLDDWVTPALEHGVTAVSGTPTFWRRTLMRHGAELRKLALEQVTLGGEPVDQAVLSQLGEAFPDARVSWIYASSEVGASIVVHDGRAGFPTQWLDRDVPGRPRLSVVDGELVITSPHHGTDASGAEMTGAVRTGDAARIEDGRVLVTGRLDRDELNVGGSKVSAGAVRDLLQSHPAIAWAAVRGRKAPLVGTMVVADVVASQDSGVTADDLTRWAAERLPEYAVPRRIKMLAEIPAKETLKSDV
ncbi:Acyl-CoA synthetase (AMP-forming)/AMP-acid ligase II [Nocardioides sp. YR527]|uniref:AMP-binding protein n=1 Tax=Nocardioides sp. YR527 TaxID=1881028 RepID=UPI00088BCB97|nr:AMP-binding protein [Nocardioides sp. YR527]SDK25867.1 Acyl-CoA synthetase (AMP-forming)/AMP-acid ligase II [Nocardioides sp. YR527]